MGKGDGAGHGHGGYQKLPGAPNNKEDDDKPVHWQMFCKALNYLWKPADTPAKLYLLRFQVHLLVSSYCAYIVVVVHEYDFTHRCQVRGIGISHHYEDGC
jgi:hypothetical protein